MNEDSSLAQQTSPPEEVREQLREHLLRLDVPAFEAFIAQLLGSLGYTNVQVKRAVHCVWTGERRRSRKGRNRHGGVDLQAYSQSELSHTLTIVQVKQYRQPVSRRFVDELRGAMLRNRAQQGLLITTSTFSDSARDAAQENPLLPVMLVDGEQLLALLFSQHLGVQQEMWSLDANFFKRFDA